MGNPIVHMEIPVTDLNKAKGFYSKLFGWKVDAMPEMVTPCLTLALNREEASTRSTR